MHDETSDDLPLLALIRSDLAAMASLVGKPWPTTAAVLDVLSLPGTWAGIFVRVGTWCHDRGLRPLSRIIYFLNHVLFSCEVQPGARIGPGLAIAHPVAVGIAKQATVGANCRMMAMTRVGGLATDDESLDGFPVIGDDCWLLDGAKVFGPVVLGDRTIVAANSLVTSSFPEGDAILIGTPARIGKSRKAE